MKKLLIVESPSKASTIQKYVKDLGFTVIASKGHIRDLPVKELGIDIKNNFETTDVTMEGKEKVIKEIKALAKDADEIYLASDPDREGEKISQSISEILPKKGKKIYRVTFNSVTKEAILKALASPGKINEPKCDAQKTRRILDRLVGYKISPILWNKMQSGLSAGRVQSVALRIIVEREDAIKAFIPETWFSIGVKFLKDDIKFDSSYFGKTIDKKHNLDNKTDADQILSLIKDKDFTVKKIDVKEKERKSTPPFTTSKLQQEAAQKLGFDAKHTMQVAQKLYEGIFVRSKGASSGLITYMRTDSVRIEPKAIEEVRNLIENKYGINYLPEKPVEYKDKKAGTVQDAHEAIRPTDLSNDPDSIKLDLSSDEYKLYSLIYNKFVASQMKNCEIEQTTIMLECEGNFFKTTGSVIKFDGFMKVFSDAAEEKKTKKGDEEESEASLPKLSLEEMLKPIEPPKVVEKTTSPPPRFNEATLVKELEDKGIGRPSTYAAIISNLTNKNYVSKEKSRFLPSELGDKLCRVLVEYFPSEMDVRFTANVEEKLDEIEDGTIKWLDYVKGFWTDFEKSLLHAQKVMVKTRQDDPNRKVEKSGIKCEKCSDGEYVVIRKGKNGPFLACSNYPVCNSTKNFVEENGQIKIVAFAKKYAGRPCPKCGKELIIIKGKNGDFLACEDNVSCKTTLPINSTGVKCPTCSKGEIVPRVSKKGTHFWSCSNYTECKAVWWENPTKPKPATEDGPSAADLEEARNENEKN